MDRYDKFADKKVRNLDGYNSSLGPNEKPMARIVIIIDELADLMMVCKKDVEEYICRLTQLARAAGIHLIVATQRPSVDVITGLIKANIPSRIAFKTASSVDSRTILDRNGAEQLLGWGDMLYAPTGSFAPTRVQGCFLSDEEVNRIAKHVKDANPSTYDPDILEKLDELANGGAEGGGADIIINSSDMSGGDGGLFEQAVEFAIQDGSINVKMAKDGKIRLCFAVHMKADKKDFADVKLQMKINELRKEVSTKYGVDIDIVDIRSTIEYV
jgi:S-DNA-T family DNA segregation ATPase FtsK/SpoIIIE